MKRIFANLITSAALLLTIGGVLQAQTLSATAQVPFVWQVNGQSVSMGSIDISTQANSHLILIRDATGGHGIFLVARPSSGDPTARRLLFHSYDGKYFLAEVDLPGVGRATVSVSGAEKELLTSAKRRETVSVTVTNIGVVTTTISAL